MSQRPLSFPVNRAHERVDIVHVPPILSGMSQLNAVAAVSLPVRLYRQVQWTL